MPTKELLATIIHNGKMYQPGVHDLDAKDAAGIEMDAPGMIRDPEDKKAKPTAKQTAEAKSFEENAAREVAERQAADAAKNKSTVVAPAVPSNTKVVSTDKGADKGAAKDGDL